jgi:hypothetical protein
MKILKYNENSETQQKELEIFIKNIIEKFNLDYILSNMYSYDCEFINKKISLMFKFVLIDEDELNIMKKISKYIKKFDNSYIMFFSPEESHETQMIICEFRISLLGYKNIYNDLEIWKNLKKYNL